MIVCFKLCRAKPNTKVKSWPFNVKRHTTLHLEITSKKPVPKAKKSDVKVMQSVP